MDEVFFLTNDFSLLENCQLYIIANYIASNYRKIAFIEWCSLKKVLLNLAKFKPLFQSLIFNKVAAYKETLVQLFSCECCETCKNTVFIEHLRWLPVVKKSRVSEIKISVLPIFGYSWYHGLPLYCKTQYPQKNTCGGVHSCCNSNLKTFKLK